MKLICALSVYNEREMLPACLKRLDEADAICLVDGAFAGFPHEVPCSTDGTLEYLDELAASDERITVLRTETAWPDEMVKRSRYLIGEEGDWYLVVDADERVYSLGELREVLVRSEKDSLCAPYYFRPQIDIPVPIPRVFKHRPGIHYEGNDARVVCDEKKLTDVGWAEGAVPIHKYGFRMVHVEHRREAMRKKARQAFSDEQWEAFEEQLDRKK